MAGDRWRIEPGPKGAIVYGPDGGTHDIRIVITFSSIQRQETRGQADGSFRFRVMRAKSVWARFRPGKRARGMERRSWPASKARPTQRRSSSSSGIPRSFLART